MSLDFDEQPATWTQQPGRVHAFRDYLCTGSFHGADNRRVGSAGRRAVAALILAYFAD